MPQYQPKFIAKDGIPSKHQGTPGEVRYGKVNGKLFIFMKVGTDWHSVPFTGSIASGTPAQTIADTIRAVTTSTTTSVSNMTADNLTVDILTVKDKFVDGSNNVIDSSNLVQHPDITSQAHPDYLKNTGNDTMDGSLKITGGGTSSGEMLRLLSDGAKETIWVGNPDFIDDNDTPYSAGRIGMGVVEAAVLGRLHVLTDNQDFIIEDDGNVKAESLVAEGSIIANTYKIGDGTNYQVFTAGSIWAGGGINTGASSGAYVDVYPLKTAFTSSSTITNLAGNHQGSAGLQWGVIADSIGDDELEFNTGQDLTKDYGVPEFVRLGIGDESQPSIALSITSAVQDKIIMWDSGNTTLAGTCIYCLWIDSLDTLYADEIGSHFLYVPGDSGDRWTVGDDSTAGLAGQLIVGDSVADGARVIQRVEHVPGSGNIVDNYGSCGESINDHDTRTECDANVTGAANHPAWDAGSLDAGAFYIYITEGGGITGLHTASFYPGGVTIGTSNAGDLNLRPAGTSDVTIQNISGLGSETHFSGWTGSGWNIARDANNEYLLEIDNLSVRGSMSVYELLIQQIRATNGSLIIGSADRVTEIEIIDADMAQQNVSFDSISVNSGQNDSFQWWVVTSDAVARVKHDTVGRTDEYAVKFENDDGFRMIEVNSTGFGNLVDGVKYLFGIWLDVSRNDTEIIWRWSADGGQEDVMAALTADAGYEQRTIEKVWDSDLYDMVGIRTEGQADYHYVRLDDFTCVLLEYKFTIESDQEDGAGGDNFIHFAKGDLILAKTWQGAVGDPPYTPTVEVRAEVVETTNSVILTASCQLYEGNTTITIIQDTGGLLKVGLRAWDGVYLPENTRIVSVSYATNEVTLTNAPTSDSTAQTIKFYSDLYPNEFRANLEPDSIQHIGSTPLDFVRIGSTFDSDRRGGIYLTADDAGAPFIDIYNGVTEWADWRDDSKSKARLGRLDGVSYDGESLTGYGLWSDNVWLTGKITATTGYIGSQDRGWEIDEYGISNTTADAEARIGIGSDGFGDANQKFWVDGSGRFSLGDKLVWDGSQLTVTGEVNIESGADVGVGYVWEYALDSSSAPEAQEVSMSYYASSSYTSDFDLGYGTTGYIHIAKLDQADSNHNTQMASMQVGEIFKIVERNDPTHQGIYKIDSTPTASQAGINGFWKFDVTVIYSSGTWDTSSGDGHADVLTGFGTPGQSYDAAWEYTLKTTSNPNAAGEWRLMYYNGSAWVDTNDWSDATRLRIWPEDSLGNNIDYELSNIFEGEGIKLQGDDPSPGNEKFALYTRGSYHNKSGYWSIDINHVISGANHTGSASSRTYFFQIGHVGIPGSDGSVWLTGSGTPADGLGAIGDFYLDTVNHDWYEKTAIDTWTLGGNFNGPPGNDGADGADGEGMTIHYDDFRPTTTGNGSPNNGDIPVPWNGTNGDEVYGGWWGMYDINSDSTTTWADVKYIMVSTRDSSNSLVDDQLNQVVDSDIVSLTGTSGGGKFRITNFQQHTGSQGPLWYTCSAFYLYGTGSGSETMQLRHTPALIFDIFGGTVPNALAGINTTGGLNAGLLLTSEVLGFHDDIAEGDGTNATLADFATYMDNVGNFYLGGSTEPTTGDKGWLAWVAGTNTLKIKGDLNIATSWGEITMTPPQARILVARHVIDESTEAEFGVINGSGGITTVGTDSSYTHNLLYSQGYENIEVSGDFETQGTASMADCRAFDVIIIDYTYWGPSTADWVFIHSLVDDGQKVMVWGNNTTTDARFIDTVGFHTTGNANCNPPEGAQHPITWEDSFNGTTTESSTYPTEFIEGVTILGIVSLNDGASDAFLGCIYKNDSSGGVIVLFSAFGDDITDPITRTRTIFYLQGCMTDTGEMMGTAATLKEGVVIDKGGIQLSGGGSIKTYGINYGDVGIFFGYDTVEDADVFSVKSATNHLLWDGTDLTVSGTINATDGVFSGHVTAGGMQIGKDISASANKDGIWVATNDYWYDDATFSLGDGGLTYSSGTLSMDVDSFAIGGVDPLTGAYLVDAINIAADTVVLEGKHIEISGETTFTGMPSTHEIGLPMQNLFSYQFGGTVGSAPLGWSTIWTSYDFGPDPEVIEIDTAAGGMSDNYGVSQFGDNAGNDTSAFFSPDGWIPYDGNSYYRIQVRIRKTAGTGNCSLGIVGVSGSWPSSVTYINKNGVNSTADQHDFAMSDRNLSEFYEIEEGWFLGHSTDAGGEHPNHSDPGHMYTGVTHIMPNIVVNGPLGGNTAGKVEIDWVRIDRFSGGKTHIDGDWIDTGIITANRIDVAGIISAEGLVITSDVAGHIGGTDTTTITGSVITTGTIAANTGTMSIDLDAGSINCTNVSFSGDVTIADGTITAAAISGGTINATELQVCVIDPSAGSLLTRHSASQDTLRYALRMANGNWNGSETASSGGLEVTGVCWGAHISATVLCAFNGNDVDNLRLQWKSDATGYTTYADFSFGLNSVNIQEVFTMCGTTTVVPSANGKIWVRATCNDSGGTLDGLEATGTSVVVHNLL